MRFLKFLLRALLTLFVITALLICFLLTPYGFKFTIFVTESMLPGQLHYQKIDGLLTGPIVIEKLNYTYKKEHIKINNMMLNWSPFALFAKELKIDQLVANGVTISIPPSKTPEKPITTKSLEENIKQLIEQLHPVKPTVLALPISLNINHAHIRNIIYQDTRGHKKAYIKSLTANGTIYPSNMNLTIKSTLLSPEKIDTYFTVRGSLKHYVMNLDFKGAHYHATIKGDGNQNAATFTIPHTTLFNGTLSGIVALHWYPKIDWKIDLNAKHVNLNVLEDRLPKSIDASLKTDGHFIKKLPDFNLSSKITADHARIATSINLHKTWNANWLINIPKLNKLYASGAGSLRSKGTVTGKLTQPETHGTVNGKDLTFNQITIGSIDGNWNLLFDKNLNSNAIFSLKNISYNDYKLNLFNLKLTGQLLTHKIQVRFDFGKHQILSTINAHYNGVDWNGTVLNFISRHNAFGNWTLKKPFDFGYTPTSAFINPFCLNANTGAFLCAQGHFKKGAPWEFSVQTKNLSAINLEKKAMMRLNLTSKASFDVHMNGIGTQITNAKANLNITPGEITYPIDNQMVNSSLRASNATLLINNNVGLKAAVNINYANNDFVTSHVSIPQFTNTEVPYKNKKISSNFKILMHDFKFVTLIESSIKLSLGKLSGDFNVIGTLGRPKLQGKATLKVSHFEYTSAQVKAHNITAHIIANKNSLKYDLTGYAHNNAPITLTGSTVFANPHSTTKFTVSTKNGELIKNKQFDVFADATLTFLINHEYRNINGTIFVTKANLKPVSFSSTLNMPTSHVVFIGLPKKVVEKKSNHKKNLNLKITLGNDVNLNAYGLHTKLGGSIDLSMTPEQATIANGQVRILKGTFQAYGQYLTLAKGSSISFIQSPASNPFIDARAYKYINTTSETLGRQLATNTVIVGVHVHGTIKNMKFTLYSQPSNISQADILSYLVLGYASSGANSANLSVLLDAANAMLDSSGGLDRPVGLTDRIKQQLGIVELGVRNETVLDAIGNPIENQSSFVVGDKLTKNIYIQYSRGMIVPDNIFKIEYQINKRWMLQTTTGTGGNVGTGADILYTISSD